MSDLIARLEALKVIPVIALKDAAQAVPLARVLVESGMLTPPSSGRGYQRKSPRINKRQYNVYVIQYRPEDESSEE